MNRFSSFMDRKNLLKKNENSVECLFRCIWKEDIHPNWRPDIKRKLGAIILIGSGIILQLIRLFLIDTYGTTTIAGEITRSDDLGMLGLLLGTFLLYRYVKSEGREYWEWWKKIEKLMKKLEYQVVIKEKMGMLGLLLGTFLLYRYVKSEGREYWEWWKKIEKLMKKLEYQVVIKEKTLGIQTNLVSMIWKWNEIDWYRIYRQVMIISVKNYYIYIDLRKLTKVEMNNLKEQLLKNSCLNRKLPLSKDCHIETLTKMKVVSNEL